MRSASHTCSRVNALSSRRSVASGFPACAGTARKTATKVAAKIAATTRYATRQPAFCPIHVTMGTPMTLAMVSPASTKATPRARLPSPISCAATSDAMPK